MLLNLYTTFIILFQCFISDMQIFLISNLTYPNIESKLNTQLEQLIFTTLRQMLKIESRKCHILP